MATTRLVGFAALPADTFAPGPAAGSAVTGNTNGRTVPFSSQPVQGFSGVQLADQNTFWFLSDNGFGNKVSSPDYLLRIYRLDPNFRGTESGDGSVQVLNFIQLADPDRRIPFPIVNENTSERLLTGSDFDPESIVLTADGSILIGEEFGPFVLRFDATGRLLEAPIATPNVVNGRLDGVVRSPDDLDVLAGRATANLPRSRGYEGMAISPDRGRVFPMLEGSVTGDPNVGLRVYELDPATARFTGLVGLYRLEAPGNAIGDFTAINANEYLVIERDGNQAEAAQLKKVYRIDLTRIDAQGFFYKEEVIDLLNIADPDDLNRDGSTTFRFPFVTIEDVVVIDERTVLVANDNNFPFSQGRPPAIDNNEIIQVQLQRPLNLDLRLGVAGLSRTALNGAAGQQTFTIQQGDKTIIDNFGGLGTGTSPSAEIRATADTLKFDGTALTARNLLLTQLGNDLQISFEGNDTRVQLNNFALERLENLPNGSGNILFNGQTRITDSFDVFDANATRSTIFNRNTVTFLNELDNTVQGFAASNDVINGQGGDDRIEGRSGDDLLRGGAGSDRLLGEAGDDTLIGGDGNDWLNGGAGNNRLQGDAGRDVFVLSTAGQSTILDFANGEDLMGLTGDLTFSQLSIVSINDNTVIRLARTGEVLATLVGVPAAAISSADFVLV